MGKRELEHRLDVLDWLLFKGDDYDPPASAPSLLERLEALEAKARDYQEDGALAMQEQARPLQEEPAMRLHVEHGPRDPHPFDTCRCGHMRMGHQEDGTCNATCGCALFCLPYHHPDGTPDIFAGAAACDLVERAETAERERDEWQVRCGFETRRADAARAALARATQAIARSRRHVEQSTGVGAGKQEYALAVLDEITDALNASPS